jgi:hypothetical protein
VEGGPAHLLRQGGERSTEEEVVGWRVGAGVEEDPTKGSRELVFECESILALRGWDEALSDEEG